MKTPKTKGVGARPNDRQPKKATKGVGARPDDRQPKKKQNGEE